MVYVLEDDLSINNLIKYALESSGFKVISLINAKELFSELNNQIPHILVLDIMLPCEDGFSILKKIKSNEKTKAIEVILLSALNQENDKVKGLDLGASDYITKPFSILEFLARIRNILRRIDCNNEIIFKDLKINLKTRIVSINEEEINLTLKEFELLTKLIKNQNICLKKEDLLKEIWGANISSRTLDIHINTLRNKLKDYAKYIITIRGVGYKIAYEN
ncbi:response regulator transcription factor [Campylobacter sp. RM12640]|nr:response regulator transcription factor [Campylobacter sp. 2018MI13]MBZ7976583.1 response regulator transcription factor [Campylobacter sp. RM12637]MBZ7982521.1 response regulator transcription factor [Campylobacter sp. RM12640]MBZ7989758.1 response regulator transcription factor [Campylobacter sp. RM12635]MBZ7991589.1 response regulator transcription factor [Campylobacter sp. RM9331]MBZ7993227.1 response regulator transcription factor [Campylobacter sp. RM9333]MBZ8005937.1 response regula